MKVLIDIPEEYELCKKQYGTPLSDNATNGDIIKAIFPTETFELSSGFIENQFGRIRIIHDKWTAPYKA